MGETWKLTHKNLQGKSAPLIFALILLLGPRAFSLDIKGRVMTAQGMPVAAAVVLHRSSGQLTRTDETGKFSLSIPGAERVRLEVLHLDYMEEIVILEAKSLGDPVTIILVPYIRQREEVVVTAMRYPEPSAKIPAAGTVVRAQSFEEKMPANISEGLLNLPGVSNLGSGGFSLVPSIRGLARRRVLLMVDYARLTSDRRTGPSASFISPEFIDRIEILRSPSSVFYGSDAIGGVVHILTKRPDGQGLINGEFNAKYGTINQETGIGFSLWGGGEKLDYFFSLQGLDAGNYDSPLGEVLQSQFTQASLLGKVSYQDEKRAVEFTFLGARGVDIGKPNVDSATKPTWYPRENQNLLQMHWKEKNVWGDGELTLRLFANPNFLETKTVTFKEFRTGEADAKTSSADFGAQLSFDKKINSSFRLTGGADYFGRAGVEAFNRYKYFDSQGNLTDMVEEYPFTDGKRSDFGLFLSGDYDGLKKLDLIGGLRFDLLFSKARPGGSSLSEKTQDVALTGFLAASMRLSDQVVFFANLSRAFRAPSLSERYYTGITGRGFIIAQPDLEAESSISLDAGIKFIGRRVFAGLYAFHYDIDKLIERYQVADKIYTYGNVDKGMINGAELEMEYFPLSGVSLFGNFTLIRGESEKTDEPLNDIPPHRIVLGTRAWVGRFSLEVNGFWQAEKDNPGPAEVRIPSAWAVNIRGSYFLNSRFRVHFAVHNLFDEAYLARPDPESIEEPGRSLVLGLSFSF